MSVSLQMTPVAARASSQDTGPLTLQLIQLIETVGADLNETKAEMFIAQVSALTLPAQHSDHVGLESKFISGGLAPWQLRRVAVHVDEHIDQTLHITRLAALIKRSSAQFCRSFKTSTGLTPSAYILQRRIDRAKQLMLETTYSLSQIALDCGFADQAHFSSRFRTQTEHSPSRWRRMHCIES